MRRGAPARAPLHLALLAALGLACATPSTPHEAARVTDLALTAAEGHVADGNPVEAAALVSAVLRVDGRHPRALALQAALGSGYEAWTEPGLLGVNRARRAPTARPLAARVLLYLPDRLLDLLDLVTVDLHLGFGLYANVHATRALQAGAGTRGVTGVGIHERRSVGMRAQSDTGFTVVAVGAEATAGRLTGTSGVFSYADALVGLHEPRDAPYQEIRDYWALGAALTAIVLGADVDLHPVQVADFAAGFVGVDFLHDDLAHTRALRLSAYERGLLRQLHEIERTGIAGPP